MENYKKKEISPNKAHWSLSVWEEPLETAVYPLRMCLLGGKSIFEVFPILIFWDIDS